MARRCKDLNTPPPVIEVAEPTTDLEDERFIRRYVKRQGGFRKGLPEVEKKAATERMAKYHRTEKDGWDTSVHIPENAAHSRNQQALLGERRFRQIAVSRQHLRGRQPPILGPGGLDPRLAGHRDHERTLP